MLLISRATMSPVVTETDYGFGYLINQISDPELGGVKEKRPKKSPDISAVFSPFVKLPLL